MKSNYRIGDTAYIVRHCPFWPSEDERKRLEADGKELMDVAIDKETTAAFSSLVKALAFAKRACKGDFWGLVEVFEARLINPYSDDIPDHMIKRSALRWESTGEYECEVER